MKLHRIVLGLIVVVGLVAAAQLAQTTEATGTKMTDAATRFVASLGADAKAKANLAFDDKERTNYNFVPLEKDKKPTRKGLRLEEMTEEQKKLALELLKSGTSAKGYEKATTIMSLEAILLDLEKGSGPVRNPGWYFVTIFGTPSKTGKWGWRVEGHHLSLNFTLDGGKVVSSTPCFFGANPATLLAGDKKGQRTLPEAEDHARNLFKSLDEGQKKVALQAKPFGEPTQNTVKPALGEPVGVAGAKLTKPQQEQLWKLIESYAERLPTDVAALELKQVKDAGLDKIHFAYSGGTEPGQGYTYRVHGPTFAIEFLNMQADGAKNPANHIHSCWRTLKGDFGIVAN